MERELHNQPSPLEYYSPFRGEVLARIALYVAFEDVMQEADKGTCSRETAISRLQELAPHLREAAVEMEERA